MKTKLEVEGKCSHVGEVKEFASGFKKREFVLRDDMQGQDGKTYTHLLAFTLTRDDVNLVQKRHEGCMLRVTGYAESREWRNPQTGEVRYFTEITAREVTSGLPVPTPKPAEPPAELSDAVVDELPF